LGRGGRVHRSSVPVAVVSRWKEAGPSLRSG
jgi:hypothetical protein